MMTRHFIKIIFTIDVKLTLPQKKEILFFDRVGLENFEKYLDINMVEVLDVRFESVNIPILLRTVYNVFIRRKYDFSLRSYLEEYIKYVEPRLVITFIDTNVYFWTLKYTFIFIFVQNGVRGLDLFSTLEKKKNKYIYSVDYMLVFGAQISELYKKYINGSTLSIGSFKNNIFSKTPCYKYDVVFVLQYKKKIRNKVYRYGNSYVTWDDCYACNDNVVQFLEAYCMRKQVKLQILGRSKDLNTQKEERLYVDSLSKYKPEYIESSGIYGSYNVLCNTRITVVIESTLGYEMLARGARVAYFGVREKTLSISSRYGWPAMLPQKGPFWTNESSKDEFERVMDFVSTSSDEDWLKACKKYVVDIIDYDPGNKKFINLMRELDGPLRLELQ